MDVVARWPGTNDAHFVDVTIRAPWAARYVASQSVPGAAAAMAWAEKTRRYPATQSVHVTLFVMECLGENAPGLCVVAAVDGQRAGSTCGKAACWPNHLQAVAYGDRQIAGIRQGGRDAHQLGVQSGEVCW